MGLTHSELHALKSICIYKRSLANTYVPMAAMRSCVVAQVVSVAATENSTKMVKPLLPTPTALKDAVWCHDVVGRMSADTSYRYHHLLGGPQTTAR